MFIAWVGTGRGATKAGMPLFCFNGVTWHTGWVQAIGAEVSTCCEHVHLLLALAESKPAGLLKTSHARRSRRRLKNRTQPDRYADNVLQTWKVPLWWCAHLVLYSLRRAEQPVQQHNFLNSPERSDSLFAIR